MLAREESRMLEKAKIKFATEGFPLIIILVGATLASFSMGPYQTYDTTMEFEAASNVVKMGFPYIQGFGTVIDQPPLGFYLEGAVFRVFGAFGVLESKYELSLKVAEPLAQMVRNQPFGTVVVASGTSCRHQISHLTPTHPRHMAEVLAEAIS